MYFKREHMSGKKNFAVISSQVDRGGKRAEKTVNVKDSAEVKKKKKKNGRNHRISTTANST